MLQEPKGLLGSGTQLARLDGGEKEGLMLWMIVAPTIVAVTIIGMTTLGMTAFAMWFMRWILGLNRFFVSVQNRAGTFRNQEASVSRAVS
jgi:hypothetical protein